jgi:hypothetical protein
VAPSGGADGSWPLAERSRTSVGSQPSSTAPADARFALALGEAQHGDHRWVHSIELDSCHTVWFQLHEDLLATFGVQRGAEPA